MIFDIFRGFFGYSAAAGFLVHIYIDLFLQIVSKCWRFNFPPTPVEKQYSQLKILLDRLYFIAESLKTKQINFWFDGDFSNKISRARFFLNEKTRKLWNVREKILKRSSRRRNLLE